MYEGGKDMKKRQVALALAAVMAVGSVAGCSGSSDTKTTTAAAAETTAAGSEAAAETTTAAPAERVKLTICSADNTFGLSTDPDMQQAVIDECGRKATEYERYINRAGDEEILGRWQNKNGVTVTTYEDLDVDSFKQAVDGVDQWFVEELKKQGYDDGEALVAAFQK